MATVDQFGSVRIPEGKVTGDLPANEHFAFIVRAFPSSSTKKGERS
jgi:hypothetical protein